MIAMILYLALMAQSSADQQVRWVCMLDGQCFSTPILKTDTSPTILGANNPPMDVPAIEHISRIENGISCFSSNTGKPMDCRPAERTWTCADKSRVLLTAEDGTRHCIKF